MVHEDERTISVFFNIMNQGCTVLLIKYLQIKKYLN